ncbi:MAG: YgcG family protein [Kordia sp.]|uniref:TPM domain-containing protein n=1 Tax=Kordia sp. TaxID=1965332 RepID=UPI003859B71B
MHYKNIFILCFLLLSISCVTEKKETFPETNREYTNTIFPKPIGFINDFEDIFSEAEETNLLNLVKAHEAETTNQIALVTIDDLKTYDNIQEYSFALANYWGVGLKDKNNGVLITISKRNRMLWIQNGDGIISELTDAETKYIVDTQIIPSFQNNDYYTGTRKAIEAIIKELTKTDDK